MLNNYIINLKTIGTHFINIINDYNITDHHNQFNNCEKIIDIESQLEIDNNYLLSNNYSINNYYCSNNKLSNNKFECIKWSRLSLTSDYEVFYKNKKYIISYQDINKIIQIINNNTYKIEQILKLHIENNLDIKTTILFLLV
jgi:hypothetical protein